MADTCDRLPQQAWIDKRWPGACYFYPARDCPAWMPGQVCGRIGDRIPEVGETLADIYLTAAAAAAGRAEQAPAARPGGLGAMLDRTRELADKWQVELDLRATGDDDDRGAGLIQAHLICSECRQSVYCLAKDLRRGVAVTSVEQLSAAVTRHYRESHTDGGGLPI